MKINTDFAAGDCQWVIQDLQFSYAGRLSLVIIGVVMLIKS